MLLLLYHNKCAHVHECRYLNTQGVGSVPGHCWLGVIVKTPESGQGEQWRAEPVGQREDKARKLHGWDMVGHLDLNSKMDDMTDMIHVSGHSLGPWTHIATGCYWGVDVARSGSDWLLISSYIHLVSFGYTWQAAHQQGEDLVQDLAGGLLDSCRGAVFDWFKLLPGSSQAKLPAYDEGSFGPCRWCQKCFEKTMVGWLEWTRFFEVTVSHDFGFLNCKTLWKMVNVCFSWSVHPTNAVLWMLLRWGTFQRWKMRCERFAGPERLGSWYRLESHSPMFFNVCWLDMAIWTPSFVD